MSNIIATFIILEFLLTADDLLVQLHDHFQSYDGCAKAACMDQQ